MLERMTHIKYVHVGINLQVNSLMLYNIKDAILKVIHLYLDEMNHKFQVQSCQQQQMVSIQ